MEKRTTIAISNKLWKKLLDLKQSSKETFEDVLWRLLKGDKNGKRNRA